MRDMLADRLGSCPIAAPWSWWNGIYRSADVYSMENSWTKHMKAAIRKDISCCGDVPRVTVLFVAGHCATTANLTLPPSNLASFVHLNLTCNVVSIQQGSVLDVFERAVMAFSRPSDPEHETGDQQVRLLTSLTQQQLSNVASQQPAQTTQWLGIMMLCSGR